MEFRFRRYALRADIWSTSEQNNHNLGKATAPPSYTATLGNVTLICAELRRDLLEAMSTCQPVLAQRNFAQLGRWKPRILTKARQWIVPSIVLLGVVVGVVVFSVKACG